jgi:hypothetical protein
MSSFADFNVGSIKLNHLGEVTQLTGTQVITPALTVNWSELVGTIQDIAEIADVVVSKQDLDNKSVSITTDAASDEKYPSVKSVKTYVDGRITEQNQFINTTMNTLQTLQDALSVSNQVDATKEDKVNKSTNIVTDAASDTKYPSVKAVKTYVDSSKGSLLVIEGESTVKGDILWTCGSSPIEGLFGVCVPSGKIRKISGLVQGASSPIHTIDVDLMCASLEEDSQLIETISLQKHTVHNLLYVLDTSEFFLPFTNNILSLQNHAAKDIDMNVVSLPPYVRFRITLEYSV